MNLRQPGGVRALTLTTVLLPSPSAQTWCCHRTRPRPAIGLSRKLSWGPSLLRTLNSYLWALSRTPAQGHPPTLGFHLPKIEVPEAPCKRGWSPAPLTPQPQGEKLGSHRPAGTGFQVSPRSVAPAPFRHLLSGLRALSHPSQV